MTLQSSGPLVLSVRRPRSRILLALQGLGVLKSPVRGIYYSFYCLRAPLREFVTSQRNNVSEAYIGDFVAFFTGTTCLALYVNNTPLSFPHVMYANSAALV